MSDHSSVQHRGPMVMLTVALIATSGVLVLLWGMSYFSYIDMQRLIKQEVRLEELRGTILHLDEVLTMSAQMGAVTGDFIWEERYLNFEPKLDAALREATSLVPAASSHLKTDQTNMANIKLVEMEKRAFALIKTGRGGAARALLFSDDYEKQKHIYSDGMQELNVSLSESISLQLQQSKQQTIWNLWALAFLILLLVVSWVVGFRAVRRWEGRLSDANTHLTQQAWDLAELNCSLDQRVDERTRALKASNHALQRSQQFLNATGRMAKVGGWELDSDTLEVSWTEETYRIHEVSPEHQLRLEDVLNFYHPEDRTTLQAAIQRALIEGKSYDLEVRCLTAREEPIWIHIIGQPHRVDGQVVQLTGTFQDITERKQMQETLSQLNHLHEQILGSVGEGIYGLDMEGKTMFANPAAAVMAGWEREELIGKSQHALIHHTYPDGSSYPREKCPIYAAFRDGQVHHVETEVFWRKDGTSFPVEYTSTPMRDKVNQVVGAVVAFRDITERKQTEAERDRLFQELESKNAELERFTYTVSHDLKSPLVTIEGFLSFVEQDARTHNLDQLNKDFQRIRGATTHMRRLLAELLELSRIGQVNNSLGIIAMNDVVRETVEHLHGAITTRGVQLEVASDLPLVKGDRTRLGEVMQNLLDNAIKFMGDQAAPRIEIGMRQEEHNVVLFIWDNGIGIAPQYQEKIFGLFERLDHKTEGTGIGLALVKRIIEVQGGRIWVESAGTGQGSTFCVVLPQVGPEDW